MDDRSPRLRHRDATSKAAASAAQRANSMVLEELDDFDDDFGDDFI
jgi:hypothetical protein